MLPLRQSLSLSGAACYEAKFLVPAGRATEILDWARNALTPDQHVDPATGFYRVTTLYLDTPGGAVLEQRGSHAYRKYRVRRYEDAALVHLERKLKRDGRVRKTRWLAPLAEWPEPGQAHWFHRRILASQLQPAAVVAYQRAAFFGGNFRLTLDRGLRISATREPHVRLGHDALAILDGEWILEVKHGGLLPVPVRDCVLRHRLVPGRFSKYRDGMRLLRDAPAHA